MPASVTSATLAPSCISLTSSADSRHLVVLVIAGGAGRDRIMIEQLLRLPRIFAGDQSTSFSTRKARSVMSSRFPIGVATR